MSKPSIVVLGGGFAGLEAAFVLRQRLQDRVSITLVSDQGDFVFRPGAVYLPFGGDAEALRVPLDEPARHRHIRLFHDYVEGIDVAERRVRLGSLTSLPFDFLLIATGARPNLAAVPGLGANAETLWSVGEAQRLRQSVERIVRMGRDGIITQVLFVVPPDAMCAAPLYEVALMLETHLRRLGARWPIRLMWATAEESYLQPFGPRADEVIAAEFQQRGIESWRGEQVEAVEPGQVSFRSGMTLSCDNVIALAPERPAVSYDGLPQDARGFVRTAMENRAVLGHDGLYAPGDAGDFPLKLAHLALLQAEASAEAIAGVVERRGPRVSFDPEAAYVIEELDGAVVVEAPLALTGRTGRVGVRPGAGDHGRAGTSLLWRLGKRALSMYVTRRFRAGEPVADGAGWKLIGAGRRGLSALTAR